MNSNHDVFFFLLIDPHGRGCAIVTLPGPTGGGGGGGVNLLFHGTEIRGYRMPRWSNNVHVDPYSHLRHWRCVLDTKQPPLLFSMYTPHRRRPATLHATVLFHSVAACQVPPKRRFFLFFSFPSAPQTTIFLLTRRFLWVLGAALVS